MQKNDAKMRNNGPDFEFTVYDLNLIFSFFIRRSMDTILAEVGHPNELFESNECQDVLLRDFYQVVTVEFVPTGSDWFENGNMHYVNKLNRNEDPSRVLYYQKRFVFYFI